MPSLCQHFNFQASKQMKFQDSLLSVNFIHDKITDPPFVCGGHPLKCQQAPENGNTGIFKIFFLDFWRRQTQGPQRRKRNRKHDESEHASTTV